MSTIATRKGKRAIFESLPGKDLSKFLKERRPDLYKIHKNPTPRMLLAMELFRRRTKLGLTQKQLAESAGIGFSTYQRIEEAQPESNPRMDVLEKLAKALKCDIKVMLISGN